MRILALLALLGCLVVSGCVAVPTHSDVYLLDREPGLGESTAHYTPAGPVAGASRTETVRGFVDAMLAYPVTWTIASEFLTPAAAREWQPSARTTIYSSIDVRSEGDEVWLAVQVEAELDRQGRRTPVERSRRIDVPMMRVDGEWRIAEPPTGNLMSTGFASDYLRPFDVFFLDTSGTRVVAEPIHAVVGDQLATALMSALAWGPNGPSAEVQTTAVPEVSELRASVPVVDSVAEVVFSSRLNDREPEDRERLAAQITWTLGQVPGVLAVRLFGATSVVTVDGVTTQPVDAWRDYGPPEGRVAQAVSQGRVFRLDEHEPSPARAPWGDDAAGARYVSWARPWMVAVTSRLATVTAGEDEESRQVRGENFMPAIVDVADRVWLVDAPGGQTRIRVVTEDDLLSVERDDAEAWSSFAVSPDGSRWVASDSVGRLVHGLVRAADDAIRLDTLGRLRLESERARAVQWLDNTSLLYLTENQQHHLRHVRIDGSQRLVWWPEVGVRLPNAEIRQLLVVPGLPAQVYVLDDEERLWYLESARWRHVQLDEVVGIS